MEKYSERLNDIAILQLDTKGFEKLTEKQKKLTYYLSKAGLWGRFISIEQGSEYNIPLFNALIKLYEKVDKSSLLYSQLHDTLFVLFSHNGVYHSMSGEKLDLPLDMKILETYSVIELELVKSIKDIWFSNKIVKFRTVQTDGVDVIKESGGNFYKNLTVDEVKLFRKENYPEIAGEEVPPFGFNERLAKNSQGEISREIISVNGLYGNYVLKIVENLTYALEFSENDKQYESIKTLIDFYQTGDAFDFDKHCVAWTQDQDSDIYFINGLIESYEDSLSIACSFESIVAFKNPLQTAKVNKIIDNIQWFEDNLPFDTKFKKEKAVGLSASSITVISMAGETSPTLPLGINLPNSDWIRKKHGSKSVNLANVSASRSSYEIPLREALFLKKYHIILEKYDNITNSLHTDLHEIAGHGSGKILDGVNTEMIGTYYSVIEETRSDLVALYYMADEKLKEYGIFDSDTNIEQAALAQYISYLTNGAIGQLRRVDFGNDLTQAHFRNRQLIALWILENSDSSQVRMVEENGLHYIEINDVQYVRKIFGKLLGKIQEIKSTGDYESAKNLVMQYGTKVDKKIHKEIIQRVKKLNMPKVIGFITPILTKEDNNIVIKQSSNFFKQQLELYEKYSILKLEKRNKPMI
jgi:dipeptidyl-peptidase-3